MSNRRLAGVLLLPALTALACGGAPPTTGTAVRETPTYSATPTPTAAQPAGRLILGIEYAHPSLAEEFRDSGASSAKPWPADGKWKLYQSGPGQPYQWERYDEFVSAYQQAGIRHLTLVIGADAEWAALDPPALLHRGDTFPKPEYEDDYAAFVQALVERYDGDGVDDMPGLLYPVTLFSFEGEYSTYWPGDAQEFIRLLQLAYPAVKAASPEAQVMPAGLLMTDVFDGLPSPEQVQARLANPDSRIFDKSAADIALLLDHPELFDALDFHSLGDYSEIIPTTTWLRQEMASRGYAKPIWIGDALNGATLNGWGPATCPKRANSGFLGYPATEADRCRVAALLEALADEDHPQHTAAIAWMRAESAAGVVRKVVIAAEEGLAGINIGNTEDWEPLMLTQGGAGTSPWQGMVDRNMFTRKLEGYRPAFYALGQVAEVIRGYVSVERLTGSDSKSYLYRFLLDDGRVVIVAWKDLGLWIEGDPPTSTETLVVGANSASVRLEWTVTEGSSPRVEIREVQDGALALDLSSIPVFVWLEGALSP